MPLIDCKCPSCGAALKINENAKGTLLCPFCGSEYLVEEAINNITNITNNEVNVSTVNNYQGATIINNGGTEEFEISKGVLEKYNGNNSEVIIPDIVRRIACTFGDYVNKVVIPPSVVDIDDMTAREIVDIVDTSKSTIFSVDDGVLYKNGSPIACGKSIERLEMPEGQDFDTDFLDFLISCTYVKEIYLPENSPIKICYRALYEGPIIVIRNLSLTRVENVHNVACEIDERFIKTYGDHFIFPDEIVDRINKNNQIYNLEANNRYLEEQIEKERDDFSYFAIPYRRMIKKRIIPFSIIVFFTIIITIVLGSQSLEHTENVIFFVIFLIVTIVLGIILLVSFLKLRTYNAERKRANGVINEYKNKIIENLSKIEELKN